MDENPFARNAQGIRKTYQEVLLLMKLLQTKPQVRKLIIKNYDLFYTVIRYRDDKEIVNDEYEIDYFNLTDLITLNLYIGRKNINETLK